MARDPLLNFDELLAPIPGDDPAGPASTYMEMRPQFEDLRREVAADRDGPSKEDVKNADWRGLERKAKEALAEASKDLRIACHLLEALVKNYGFAGGHDGLKLLRLLVEKCWDRLNPPVDPEDPEVRAAPFNWIDDPYLGLRFPSALRLTPLLIGPDKAYSLLELRTQGKDEAALQTRREIDQTIETTPSANLTGALEEVKGCLEELRRLTEDLAAKLGAVSPGMTTLRGVLEECRTFLQQILQKRPDAEIKSDTGTEDGAAAVAGAAAGPAGPATSRAEIYRQLRQAAQALKELEPHSPIPYLLLRAVDLGQMPFPQLMLELIRDPSALTELKREFGIRDAAPPAK